MMRRIFPLVSILAATVPGAIAQTPTAPRAPTTRKPALTQVMPPASNAPLVEFEMMTWPEVKRALESGKTTALVYNGGTEQRGPQNVNGGHTLMARATVRMIALKLGNAIAAPVMPFSPNNASAELPGTIGLPPQLYAALNTQVVEQLITTGFKNVVLMGDHGGGQKELGDVARALNERYAGRGIRVVFCDEVYSKANNDFDTWLATQGYPKSSHAGIPDTSEMLFLGGSRGWVRRELIKSAVGDAIPEPGQRPARQVNNGITGDARRSSSELGKRIFEMKVEYAVRQIKQLLAPTAQAADQR
jgi:creatinine amidohydrolase/Fe(II)-dependent formamide hydrolase-like protein